MNDKKLYTWVVVALLWVVALLNYMDRQMLSTMQEAMKIDIIELTNAEAFGALMPILCQFVSAKYRGTAYGIMNMTGVFAGATVTQLIRKVD